MNKGKLESVSAQEVNFLVSCRRLASGNSLRENIQDFESLSPRLLSSAKTQGLRRRIVLVPGMQRKHTFSIRRPTIQSMCSCNFPEGTIVGPVIEVHIVEVLENFGLESVWWREEEREEKEEEKREERKRGKKREERKRERARKSKNSISKQSKTDILCSDIQVKESIRGRTAYAKCQTYSHQRGIAL